MIQNMSDGFRCIGLCFCVESQQQAELNCHLLHKSWDILVPGGTAALVETHKIRRAVPVWSALISISHKKIILLSSDHLQYSLHSVDVKRHLLEERQISICMKMKYSQVKYYLKYAKKKQYGNITYWADWIISLTLFKTILAWQSKTPTTLFILHTGTCTLVAPNLNCCAYCRNKLMNTNHQGIRYVLFKSFNESGSTYWASKSSISKMIC
jgi:hypothetical protein